MNSTTKMPLQNQSVPALIESLKTVAIAICVITAAMGTYPLLAPAEAGAARAPMFRAERIGANLTRDIQRDAARFPHRFPTPGGNVVGLN